jgi:hypothetical protein
MVKLLEPEPLVIEKVIILFVLSSDSKLEKLLEQLVLLELLLKELPSLALPSS